MNDNIRIASPKSTSKSTPTTTPSEHVGAPTLLMADGIGHGASSMDDHVERVVDRCGIFHTDDSSEWWSWARIGDPYGFDAGPPWSEAAQDRLVRFTLPFDISLTLDPETALVRATDVATRYNKRVIEWLGLGIRDLTNRSGTRGVAFALASTLGISPEKLVFTVDGGRHSGTWIHVRLMFHFAGWCHAPLAVHVNDIALRFYSGHITTEQSRVAFKSVARTVRSEQTDETTNEGVLTSGQNRLTTRPINQRARIRDMSVPCDAGQTGVPTFQVPAHLIATPGVYVANFGIVKHPQKPGPHVHLKVGKAVEQPVVSRLRDHRSQAPHTFQLSWMAGADAPHCSYVEDTAKLVAKRLGFDVVPATSEEWLVPLDDFKDAHAAILAAIEHDHRPLLTTVADEPAALDRALELEKFKFNGKLELIRAMINGGDASLRKEAMRTMRELA
jgi:hypothetical protein